MTYMTYMVLECLASVYFNKRLNKVTSVQSSKSFLSEINGSFHFFSLNTGNKIHDKRVN